MSPSLITKAIVIAVCVSAMYDPSLAQGIYYNEITGETVTSDGRAAFTRDIPMPLAPPYLPPNQRRRIIIIQRPQLRYVVKHWVDHRHHAGQHSKKAARR